MLDEAISLLRNDEHPVVHSDQGSHYRWLGWIDRMKEAGLIRSMSKKDVPQMIRPVKDSLVGLVLHQGRNFRWVWAGFLQGFVVVFGGRQPTGVVRLALQKSFSKRNLHFLTWSGPPGLFIS